MSPVQLVARAAEPDCIGGLDEGVESAPEDDTAHGACGITLARPLRQLPLFFYPIAQTGPLVVFLLNAVLKYLYTINIDIGQK
jgi:hypothetical protein